MCNQKYKKVDKASAPKRTRERSQKKGFNLAGPLQIKMRYYILINFRMTEYDRHLERPSEILQSSGTSVFLQLNLLCFWVQFFVFCGVFCLIYIKCVYTSVCICFAYWGSCGLFPSLWLRAPSLWQCPFPSEVKADSSSGRDSHHLFMQSLLLYEIDQNGTFQSISLTAGRRDIPM